jgi:hypothetical protein
LIAQPDTNLLVRGTTGKLRARLANPQEMAEVWPRCIAVPCADYQK